MQNNASGHLAKVLVSMAIKTQGRLQEKKNLAPFTVTPSIHGGGGGEETQAPGMQRARVGPLPHLPGPVAGWPSASSHPLLTLRGSTKQGSK